MALTLAQLARHNYALKQGQIAKLRPAKMEARAKIDALQNGKRIAAGARESLELMKSLKHIPGFFPTPRALVSRMIEAADLRPGMSALEPSAGKGDIAIALIGAGIERENLQCIEQNPTLVKHLQKLEFKVYGSDFLSFSAPFRFDRVLMNPPFERSADEKHIKHAYTFLHYGGRLVAICSSTTGRSLAPWIAARRGSLEELPAGSFSNSENPTGVNTCLVIVDRP